ncbi:MAG: HEAT repeat domain-containing protein [Planctomycetes bacterium]|nr:HEAT repeat domain-containing protein [Planctomycetota bacterium]
MLRRSAQALVLTLTVAAVCPMGQIARALTPPDPAIDSPMFKDPYVEPATEVTAFAPRLKELWLAALDDPIADTRRLAADAIGQASELGMTTLADAGPRLADLLTKPDPEPLVRLAAAAALVRMNHRAAAPALLERAGADGTDMTLLADKALALWDYQPARAFWRKRLTNAAERRVLRRSAIESLGTVRDAQAFDDLLKIATQTPDDPGLALAAARAAGVTRPQDRRLDDEAKILSAGATPQRLTALALLETDNSPGAIELLTRFAADPEPAVAAAALRRLDAAQPDLARPLALTQLANADPTVREVSLRNVARGESTETITAITPLLTDPDVNLRRAARDALARLHPNPDLSAAVEQVAASSIHGEWRAREQGAILTALIGRAQAWPDMMPLLDDAQPQVRLAAAFSLRRLRAPESLPEVLSHVKKLIATAADLSKADQITRGKAAAESDSFDRTGANDRQPDKSVIDTSTAARLNHDTDYELAQLVQLLTLSDYQPADAVMLGMAPKHSVPWYRARAAAIWGLGKFHHGGDAGLETLLLARATDNSPTDPEVPEVRCAAIIALGIMKPAQAVATLRAMHEQPSEFPAVIAASRWSLINITGTPLPPDIRTNNEINWFLTPLQPGRKPQ